MFPLIDMIRFDLQCSEKLFDQIVKALMLFPAVFKNQIVRQSFAVEQGNSDRVLSCEVLRQKQRSGRFIDTFEFGIESTVVEPDLFDNPRTLDVVMIRCEF